MTRDAAYLAGWQAATDFIRYHLHANTDPEVDWPRLDPTLDNAEFEAVRAGAWLAERGVGGLDEDGAA